MNKNKPVLVTTVHRGVFFGREESRNGNSIILTTCRNCIYWGGTQGFLRLAKVGPEGGDKIGAVADRVELFDVTSIADTTESAAAAWDKA